VGWGGREPTGAGRPSHSRLNPRGNTSRSLRSTLLALLSAGKATPFRRRTAAANALHPVTRLCGTCGGSSAHAAAAQTRRVQPASLLQAHLQVRRSTRCLGQLYKRGFTELCNVIMRTNETPLAAATHKLNQLKDKAGLSDAPADDSGRPGAFVDEQQPEACGGPAQQLTQQL
jgi:hypothetical protein